MTTAKETPEEQKVEDIAAVISQRREELKTAEDALIAKQQEVTAIKDSLRILEDSVRIGQMKDSKVPSLAGKWYRDDAHRHNRNCKHYVFVKEDLGFVMFGDDNNLRRKLKIVDLFIDNRNLGSETRTEISLRDYSNYSFYSDPNILKPVDSEEVRKYLKRQCNNYITRMKDFGVNVRLTTPKEKKK